jgi:RND family efflux transporter MFP subunit
MSRLRTGLSSVVVAVGALGAVAALYIVGYWKSQAATDVGGKPSADVVAVTVASVLTQPVQRIVPIVGTLHGLEEVPISAKVDGRIVRIRRDVGDVVRPGDVLFEIDPVEYQLKVNEAARSLELELSKLGLDTVPDKDVDVDVNRLPAVVRAASQLKLAQLEFERSSALVVQRTVSQADFDKVQTDLALARANYEQAVLDARTTLAAVRWKQAALESAASDLAETRVAVPDQSATLGRAGEPVEYVVAERSVTEGEVVRAAGAQPAAFRLVIADPLKLRAAVAERFKPEVVVGLPVGVLTEATGDEMFFGAVKRVNPTVDRASRTFQVEVEVPNPLRRLAVGSFAKAGIRTRLDENALTVPAEAVVRFAGVVKVFVVRGGKAVGVPVELGERVESEAQGTKTRIEVRGDLSPADAVVTSGQSQLADHTPVVVRDDRPPASGPPPAVSSAAEAVQ